jgi:hypothetical protein
LKAVAALEVAGALSKLKSISREEEEVATSRFLASPPRTSTPRSILLKTSLGFEILSGFQVRSKKHIISLLSKFHCMSPEKVCPKPFT